MGIFQPRPTVKDSCNSRSCEGSSRIRKRALEGPPSLAQRASGTKGVGEVRDMTRHRDSLRCASKSPGISPKLPRGQRSESPPARWHLEKTPLSVKTIVKYTLKTKSLSYKTQTLQPCLDILPHDSPRAREGW